MGLSLKKLATGVWNQINPLDNGRTFSNPQGSAPQQQAQHQAPPSAWQQLTNSGAGHVVAPVVNLGKSLGEAVIHTGGIPIEAARTGVAALTHDQAAENAAKQRFGTDIHSALGILRAAPDAAYSLGESLNPAGGDVYNRYHTFQNPLARAIFGSAPIPSMQTQYKLDKQEHGRGYASANAGLTAVMDALGGKSIAKAGLRVGPKVVRNVPKVALKTADAAKSAVETYKAVNPGVERVSLKEPTAKVSMKTGPAPKITDASAPAVIRDIPTPGRVATGRTVIQKTGIPEIDQAIADVSAMHANPTRIQGDVPQIMDLAQGRITNATRAANNLRKTLTKNLTKDENQQISDLLDNHPVEATARARKVAASLRQLQEQAFKVRQNIKPDINRVEHYNPRIPANAVRTAVKNTGRVLGQIRDIGDITDLNSVFSQSRKIGKFVDKNGKAIYGDPAKLGLVRKGNGAMLRDSKGRPWQQVEVSKRELEANGQGVYEHHAGRIAGIYHADTGALKVRGEVVAALKKSPQQHGLFTEAEIRSGKGPKDAVPITKVADLATKDGGHFYASAKDVKALEDSFGFKKRESRWWKLYDVPSSVATQSIVLNPFFHGMNQLYQAAIAAGNLPGIGNGWIRLAKGVGEVSERDIRDYFEEGGHSPTYGSSKENLLSHLTKGASKVNSKSMAAIELRLRVGLYKASREAGMDATKAVKNIDRFLGDKHQFGPTARRFTLFLHYFKTMGGAIGTQLRHPIQQKGSIINTVTLAAITAAVSHEYQQWTGNQDAYARMPGELSIIKEAIKAPGEIVSGEAPSIITNRVNPVAKEVAQQVFDKDLFTGQHVTDTGRLQHAGKTLVAPAQVVERAGNGSRSLAETGLNQLGIYTPHAKGYQVAPKGGKVGKALNTKDSLPGTGMAEQRAYFSGLKQAQKSLAGPDNKKTLAAFNDYLARSKDKNTGQTIQNSPSESIQNASALFANDKLRKTIQKFEQSQPSHSPVWDLPDDKLKAYMQYKEQFTGDAAKTFLLAQSMDDKGHSWIKDVQDAESKFYDSLPHRPGSKPPKASDQTPEYPKFDKPTQDALDAYDNADVDQQKQLLKDHGDTLINAWNQVANWTNAMRKAEGAPELKDRPQADKETQAIIDEYNALPTHDGKKGGNKSRSLWIQAHPDAFKKMTDYYTQASMSSLIKNAALAQFKGSDVNQKLLKAIYNLGQYDVGKNSDGTYSLGGSSGGSSSYTPYTKYSSSSSYKSSAGYKDARYLSNAVSLNVDNNKSDGRVKGPKTGFKVNKAKLPGAKIKKPAKRITSVNKPKVTLKKSTV